MNFSNVKTLFSNNLRKKAYILPEKFNLPLYFQHAFLLIAVAIGAGLLLQLDPDFPLKNPIDLDLNLMKLIGVFAGAYFLYRVSHFFKYFKWRINIQLQNRTVQFFLYGLSISAIHILYIKLNLLSHAYLEQAVILHILVTVLSFIYVISAFVYQHNSKVALRTPNTRYITDRPSEELPLPSQQQPLAALNNLIETAYDQDDNGALSIAIDGAYGDGKSSLIKMLTKYPVMSKYVMVSFEPWRYTNQEALVKGFYEEIGKRVQAELPGFQMTQSEMVKFAQNYISDVDKTGVAKTIFSRYNKTADANPAKLNAHLKNHNKKLLVVIDDLDRINNDNHVMRTLQLAQYLKSDVERSVIIFLADMDRIENAVPQRIRKGYLQKFFDVTLTINQPRPSELKSFIEGKLSELSLNLDIGTALDGELLNLIRNIRGAKRILSMYAADIENIGDNVNHADMFFMRVIFYAYPTLFADMRNNPSMYYEYSFDFEDPLYSIYGFENETFEEDQQAHFENLIGNLSKAPSDIRKIKNILGEHFPHLKNIFLESGIGKSRINYAEFDKNRRIGSRDYLDRYFTYSENVDKRNAIEDLVKNFLTDDYVSTEDSSRTQKLIDFNNQAGNENRKLFFTLLLSQAEDVDNRYKISLYRDILRTYFCSNLYLTRAEESDLHNILEAINRFVSDEDYAEVFAEIEKYMNHPSTGLRLLLYISPSQKPGGSGIISYSGFEQLRKDILSFTDNYYINESRDVFSEEASNNKEWRFTLFQWAASAAYNRIQDVDPKRFKNVNSYIIKLIENDPKRLHEFIMGAFWEHDLNRNIHRFIFNISPGAYDVPYFVEYIERLLQNESIMENVSSDIRKDFGEFVRQYYQFNTAKRAERAPTASLDDPNIKWASNYMGVGAAFKIKLKVDNFGGEANYLIGIVINAKLEDDTEWQSKVYIAEDIKSNEPIPFAANEILTKEIFISDTLQPNRQMPVFKEGKATLDLVYRNGKKQTIPLPSGTFQIH